MKCPKCSRDHKYKDGMTCRCGYRFAVDPKKWKLSDNKIVVSAKKASGEFKNWYTFNQLLTAATTGNGAGSVGCLVVIAILLAAGGVLFWLGKDVWVTPLIFVLPAFAIWLCIDPKISKKKFRDALALYESAHGQLEKRLIDNQPLATRPPPAVEEDLYDYGVEAVVIVDRDLIVDLLVLNHWAAENRALVVSEGGYPEYLIERANQILRDQPDVPVFVLHDASEAGEAMAERVRRSEHYHINGHQVIDLGLSREQVRGGKLIKTFAAKDGSVPIDHVSWARMAPVFAGAIAGQMAIAELINPQNTSTETWYDSGGFG